MDSPNSMQGDEPVNQSMEPTGASLCGHCKCGRGQRLAPAAHACRYRDVKLHSILFGWSNPDQALRVAAGIPGKRASGGRTRALRVHYQGCEAFPPMHRTWKPQSGVELELGDMVKTK